MNCQRIIRAVAAQYGINTDVITSASRERYHVRPRMIAMGLCYKLIDKASTTKIGAVFNRDHTTVSNALKHVNAVSQGRHSGTLNEEDRKNFHRLLVSLTHEKQLERRSRNLRRVNSDYVESRMGIVEHRGLVK